MDGLKTLQEAIIHFSDYENCTAVMMKLRWPDGKVQCPHCGSDKVDLPREESRVEMLHRTSEAEVLAEDRNHLRGFTARTGQVACCAVARCELQERHQFVRDCA